MEDLVVNSVFCDAKTGNLFLIEAMRVRSGPSTNWKAQWEYQLFSPYSRGVWTKEKYLTEVLESGRVAYLGRL